MATLNDEPEEFFGRATARSRILLINPPVEERRYHWIRWNQPLDLLKLSTWFKNKRSSIDIRLYDFMLPSLSGTVTKRLVKDNTEPGIWQFGHRYEEFGQWFTDLLDREGWIPTYVVITSLTSYWSMSIEKLLTQILQRLGPRHRKKVKICLYGAYPRFEPDDAESQFADIAFTSTVDTSGCTPDLKLYLDGPERRLPNFVALDIRDENVASQVRSLLRLKDRIAKAQGNARPQNLTVAFFNEDVASETTNLESLANMVQDKLEGRIFIEGICGIQARSLTSERLGLLQRAGFRSLFIEHARLEGGALDREAYAAVDQEVQRLRRERRRGDISGFGRDAVTGFVYVGLPGDELNQIVEATLELNAMFGAVIMKPFGWDPEIGPAVRDEFWNEPRHASPQWFPYVGRGSPLRQEDYEDLMRWQNILNMRVKGATFDFLDDGKIATLVRETLVQESWKRHAQP